MWDHEVVECEDTCPTASRQPRITPLMRLISLHEAVYGPTSTAELAVICGVSDRAIRKAKRALTGLPPFEWAEPQFREERNSSSGGTPVPRNHSSASGTTVPGEAEPQFRERNHSSALEPPPSRARIESPSGILLPKKEKILSDSESGGYSAREAFGRDAFGAPHTEATFRDTLSRSVGGALRDRDRRLGEGVALVLGFHRRGLTVEDAMRSIRKQAAGRGAQSIASWRYFEPGLEEALALKLEVRERRRRQQEQTRRRLELPGMSLSENAQRYTGPDVPPGYPHAA